MTPLEKFGEWFERPLKELESLKDCNAAFLAFMVSFGLFERFIKSDLKLRGIDGNPENFRAEAAKILRLERDLFDKFWGMYRDGIQHYLQPKRFCSKGVKYDWQISADFGALPKWFDPKDPLEKIMIIRISPWKWSKHVLCLWHSRLDLLEILDSHRLGEVFEE